MLSSLSKLEVKIGEHVYQFMCTNDSPLGGAFDALTAMRAFILQRMQDVDNAEKCAKKEEEVNG